MVGKLVVLKLDGDLKGGMRVTFEIGEEGTRPQTELVRQISPDPEIALKYQNWRSIYRRLGMQTRAIKGAKATIDGSIQKRREDCRRSSVELERCLNAWLKGESFLPIREKWSEILSPPSEEARILIRTSCPELRQLPWQIWDFLERYPNAEVALSSPESEQPPKAKVPTERDKVRILAILGNSRGIDVEEDRRFLNSLPDAVTTFLAQPERKEIDDQLWEQTWDILFFAGHSRTEGERGRIYINQTDSLSLDELRGGLKKAIANGLQIAIFNSCDGLGLAGELEQLHVPQLIVMREPVPDRVAQEFIKSFLSAFSGGQSFYLAAREARLRLGVLENQFPNASWLPTICQNSAAVPPTWGDLGRRPTERCPYRGLFAFREEDARFFFGRDAFTKILVEAIAKQPFVAVIGPSGSGKSSVVFAGLIPNLPGGANWRPIAFRPGDRPLNALAGALIREMEPNLSQSDRLFKTRHLADHLRQKEGGLRDAVDEFARDNPETRLLLVADQFEELYTLCRDASERQVFLDRLIEAVESPFNFRLAITLRADFFGQALSYRRFADALQYADLKLGPMNRDEMERAIAKPAELLGVTVEEGLTKRILDAVGPSSGDLPLLEFALTQLWEKQGDNQLTHATYDAIGGVERALAGHAEEAYRQLDEEEKGRVQQILIQLVKPGDETEDTRRLATRGEVGEENWDLVTRLASARLVVTDTRGETGEETVEIVHEALIKGWFRLNQWLEADRAFRTWQERSRAALKQWQASDRDEGALLRGAPLAEAEGWLKERPGEISPAEKVFIRRGLSVRSRQRRVFILGLSVGLAIALVLTGTATWLWWREQQRRKEEEIRADAATTERLFDSEQLWEGRIETIKVAKKLRRMNRVETQTWGQVYRLLYRAFAGDGFQERNRLEGYDERVTGVSFSPDGETIATTSGNAIQLWTRDGKKLQTLSGHTGEVMNVSFSPDGEMIASASKDKTVKLWRQNGKLLQTLQGHESKVYSVEFSPDGQVLASASIADLESPKPVAGTVRLWDREGSLLKIIKREEAEKNGIISVSFSPDGELLALAYLSSTVCGKQVAGAVELLNRQGKLLHSWNESALDVSFSPDSQTIAVASDDVVKLLSRDGKKLKTLVGHSNNVTSVSFSPDGQTLASASLDKTIKIWDLNEKEILHTLPGHTDEIEEVSFSPDGQTLATASKDKTVRLWSQKKVNTTIDGWYRSDVSSPNFYTNDRYIPPDRTVNGKVFKTSIGNYSVNSISLSPDGRIIASAASNAVELWKRNRTKVEIFGGRYPDIGAINSVGFSPDGQTLALVTDGAIVIQPLKGGFILIDSPDAGGVEVSFSPDGKSFVTTALTIWSIDGTLLNTLGDASEGHTDRVFDVSFSPDGQLIASASFDKTVKLWRRDGTLVRTFTGHEGEVTSVSFSPDGQTIASASADKTVKLWDLDGTFRRTLRGHKDIVNRVSFSADGKMIATASHDTTVKLWSLDGQLLKTLEGHTAYVWDVSFSPDGQFLASGSADNRTILWNLEVDSLLAKICILGQDYLKNNPNVNESDRFLCDDIGMSQSFQFLPFLP